MATVAEQVAEHIAADNPTFILKSYPAALENVPTGKVAVHVYRTTLTKPTDNVLGHALNILVVIPGTAFSAASETALEAALDDLLISLETFDGLQWSEAKRTTAEDMFPNAYEITATCSSVNVYRPSHQPPAS